MLCEKMMAEWMMDDKEEEEMHILPVWRQLYVFRKKMRKEVHENS